MKTSEHAKILKTYIDRLSTKDIKDILYHHESCQQEFLNGNAISQANADIILRGAILNIIEKMLVTDKNNIERIIEKTINKRGE